MVNIIVAGCAGRMGRTISTLVCSNEGAKLVGGFENKTSYAIGADLGELVGEKKLGKVVVDDLAKVIGDCNIIIDFTSPDVTMKNLKLAVKNKKGIVIGTTGLNASEEKKIKEASKQIPIVFAPNMSVGVNLLFKLSKMVASTLSDDYDIEIVEAHHKHKKDAPSGTACELAKQVAAGRKVELDKKAIYGRKGICGEREKGTIGIHAIRGGDVVGDHTVSFMTLGERVELTHRASSRDAFAKGAIVAAKFIAKKRKGLYNMQDVLGL